LMDIQKCLVCQACLVGMIRGGSGLQSRLKVLVYATNDGSSPSVFWLRLQAAR
jgi:hypothetical protein